MTSPQALVARAVAARQNAYCDYSQFAVGAALLLTDGTVITGANVENASYGLTVCAERTAVFQAANRGYRFGSFAALAVVTEPGASLCGACRQVVREFTRDLPIYLGKPDGTYRETSLAALLPESFGPDSLAGRD